MNLRFQLALAALIVVAGCGTQTGEERPPRPSVKPGEFGVADCFIPRMASDFRVLDDRNLIVFAPSRSDAYHVQVSPPSPDLRFAETLAFESRRSRLCGYAGDSLRILDRAQPDFELSVTGVYRLDERALDGLQARFGTRASPAGTVPEPGEGAAIERELDEPR